MGNKPVGNKQVGRAWGCCWGAGLWADALASAVTWSCGSVVFSTVAFRFTFVGSVTSVGNGGGGGGGGASVKNGQEVGTTSTPGLP